MTTHARGQYKADAPTNRVQVVWSSRRGSRSIEHPVSAHDEQKLEALKAAARQPAADPLPEDLCQALDTINHGKRGTH